MDIATKITKTKADIESLEARLDTLKAKLKEEHPNHCQHCGGQGGQEHHDNGGRWEPPHSEWEECPHCFGQELHPLDITRTMTEDEAEDWVEVSAEEMHPTLKEILDTELNLDASKEYLTYLEIEEVEEALEEAHAEWARGIAFPLKGRVN